MCLFLEKTPPYITKKGSGSALCIVFWGPVILMKSLRVSISEEMEHQPRKARKTHHSLSNVIKNDCGVTEPGIFFKLKMNLLEGWFS